MDQQFIDFYRERQPIIPLDIVCQGLVDQLVFLIRMYHYHGSIELDSVVQDKLLYNAELKDTGLFQLLMRIIEEKD